MPRLETTPRNTPARPSRDHTARWWTLLGVVLTTSFIACSEEENTALSPGDERPPTPIIREYPNGCPVEVIETSSEDTDTVLVTFDGLVNEFCAPKLAQWGIDLADPVGVDTPQGNQLFQIDRSRMANLPPSPSTAGLPNNAVRVTHPTPPQVMIEFDPPVNSVEFYYSRFFGERAYWNGLIEASDSMMVWAMSRVPGTLSYNTYASRKLYSNTPATVPQIWSVWEPVKLSASTDKIQWLWLNGAASIDLLRITRTRPPTIRVECSPQFPVRGTDVSCTASLTPGRGTELVVNRWTFLGTNVPSNITEATNATTWSGVAAFGGTVIVDATVDGVSKSGSGSFGITARSGWSQKHGVHIVYEAPSLLPIHPTGDADLGQTRSFPFGWAPPDRIAQVTSGPNQGWYYAIDVPLKDSSEVMINRAALAVGSDFYNLQRTRASGGWCSRDSVPAFVPLAEAHEGLNFELYSHTGAYSRTLDQRGGDLVEGAVGPTPEDLAARARDAALPAINAADAASELIDTEHPIPYCKFRYY